MKRISDFIAEELAAAFEAAGYDRNYAKYIVERRILASISVMVLWQEQKLIIKHRS